MNLADRFDHLRALLAARHGADFDEIDRHLDALHTDVHYHLGHGHVGQHRRCHPHQPRATITVTATSTEGLPMALFAPGQTITFHAGTTDDGVPVADNYQWTVTAGTPVAGPDSTTITVSDAPNGPVTATATDTDGVSGSVTVVVGIRVVTVTAS